MSDQHESGNAVVDGVVHEVDGIQEQDNKLPRWWLASLFLTIVFSYGYWQFYEVMKVQGGLMSEYAEAKEHEDAKHGRDTVSDGTLLALSKGHEAEEGAKTFATTCAACHGSGGEGKIGPNLTDRFWLHGGRPSDIYATVTNGYPLKGMPSWKAALGPSKIKEVTAYILTLRNKELPGKAPEGDELKDDGAAAVPAEATTKNTGT